MFYLCLTHGASIREKDRIPFGWCFRTQPRETHRERGANCHVILGSYQSALLVSFTPLISANRGNKLTPPMMLVLMAAGVALLFQVYAKVIFYSGFSRSPLSFPSCLITRSSPPFVMQGIPIKWGRAELQMAVLNERKSGVWGRERGNWEFTRAELGKQAWFGTSAIAEDVGETRELVWGGLPLQRASRCVIIFVGMFSE